MIKCKLLTRIIVTIICFSFVVVAPDDMLAEEYKLDKTVDILTQDEFQNLFATKKRSTNVLSVDSVKYIYDFCVQEGKNIAEVWMNVIFSISGVDYDVELRGVVSGSVLLDGEIFWEGPIEGTIVINETKYLVIASFSKIGTLSDDIQVCATIQSLHNDNSISPVSIQFGEDVITKEVYSQITGTTLNDSITESNGYKMDGTRVFQPGTSITIPFYDSTRVQFNGAAMSGNAQYLSVYCSTDNTNRIAGKILTYPNNVNAFFASLGTSVTDVYSFTISLVREPYTNGSYSYIVGTELFDFEISNLGKSGIDLKPLFDDALALVGYSSATIDSLLESLQGKVTRTIGSNAGSVTVQGLNDDTICNNYGLPVVFQLSPANAGYTGNSQYTMSSTVRYISIYLPWGSSVYTISYTDGGTAEVPITMTLATD